MVDAAHRLRVGALRNGRMALEADPPLKPGWYVLRCDARGDALSVVSFRLPASGSSAATGEDDLVVPLRAVAEARYEAVLRLPSTARTAVLEIASADPDGAAAFEVFGLSAQPLSPVARLSFMARKAWRLLRGGDMPLRIAARVMWQRLVSRDAHGFAPVDDSLSREERYRRWVALYDPEPSVPQPTANDTEESPTTLVWVLGGDAATHEATRAALDVQEGARWSVTEVGAGPGRSFADAMRTLPEEAYVVLLRAGDRPRAHMLATLGLALESAVAAYGDDDERSADGARADPSFKPAYSPLHLRGRDYIGSGLAVRAFRLREIAWATSTLDAAETPAEAVWAFNLATTAGLSEAEIRRVPRVLHHRAAHEDAQRPPAEAISRHAEADREAWTWRHGAETPLPDRPRVSLIVPTRDGLHVLRPCIEGFQATDWHDLEILIVDNGSEHGETHAFFDSVTAADPRVRVLTRPGPFNYSALNNAAAKVATGTVLGLVNNDIEVTDPGWLAHMVALARMPQHGIVGARLLYPDGTLQHGGVVIGPDGLARHRMPRAVPGDPAPRGLLSVPQEVSAVTAACLVLRRSVFDRVEGLDEDAFPVSFNDVDLCLKVRAAGYRVIWTPNATLVHHESISRGSDLTGPRAVRARRETNALRARWAPFHDPYYNPNLDPSRADYMPRF